MRNLFRPPLFLTDVIQDDVPGNPEQPPSQLAIAPDWNGGPADAEKNVLCPVPSRVRTSGRSIHVPKYTVVILREQRFRIGHGLGIEERPAAAILSWGPKFAGASLLIGKPKRRYVRVDDCRVDSFDGAGFSVATGPNRWLRST